MEAAESAAVPLVVTLAGGYARRAEESVAIHVATIEEARRVAARAYEIGSQDGFLRRARHGAVGDVQDGGIVTVRGRQLRQQSIDRHRHVALPGVNLDLLPTRKLRHR